MNPACSRLPTRFAPQQDFSRRGVCPSPATTAGFQLSVVWRLSPRQAVVGKQQPDSASAAHAHGTLRRPVHPAARPMRSIAARAADSGGGGLSAEVGTHGGGYSGGGGSSMGGGGAGAGGGGPSPTGGPSFWAILFWPLKFAFAVATWPFKVVFALLTWTVKLIFGLVKWTLHLSFWTLTWALLLLVLASVASSVYEAALAAEGGATRGRSGGGVSRSSASAGAQDRSLADKIRRSVVIDREEAARAAQRAQELEGQAKAGEALLEIGERVGAAVSDWLNGRSPRS